MIHGLAIVFDLYALPREGNLINTLTQGVCVSALQGAEDPSRRRAKHCDKKVLHHHGFLLLQICLAQNDSDALANCTLSCLFSMWLCRIQPYEIWWVNTNKVTDQWSNTAWTAVGNTFCLTAQCVKQCIVFWLEEYCIHGIDKFKKCIYLCTIMVFDYIL